MNDEILEEEEVKDASSEENVNTAGENSPDECKEAAAEAETSADGGACENTDATEGAAEDKAEETGGEKKKERKLKWAKKAADKEAKEAASEEAEKLEAKLAEANDKYVRLFAEFDNFRNRSEKEKSTMYDFGAKDMITKILPVLDNFERGMAVLPEDQEKSPFEDGMDKVLKQFKTMLEDAGVKEIEAVGCEFDPNLHNAVMHVDDESVGANIIVEEFQKGYTYKGSVVRYSMVKVAN